MPQPTSQLPDAQRDARSSFERPRTVFAPALWLAVAVAAVNALCGSAAQSTVPRPEAASTQSAVGERRVVPAVTAQAPHLPEVEHGNDTEPKWLVERPEVAPTYRFMYRSAGATVGAAGGFYKLVLTA
jgi:hypothetical protein